MRFDSVTVAPNRLARAELGAIGADLSAHAHLPPPINSAISETRRSLESVKGLVVHAARKQYTPTITLNLAV